MQERIGYSRKYQKESARAEGKRRGVFSRMKGQDGLYFMLACFALPFASASGQRFSAFAGPYTVTVRNVNNETDEYTSTGNFWLRLYFTSPKPKQLQYAWGRGYLNMDVSDDLKWGYSEIRNQSVSPVFPQFPVAHYGRWLFTLAFLHGRKTVGVIVADVNTSPKL